MTILPRLRFVCLSVVLLLITSGVALAQHDPVTGGGMIGGSTERSSKPATKPANKPASTTTPRRRTTPAPVKRPTTTTVSADTYYQQGEALYNAKKYREALE